MMETKRLRRTALFTLALLLALATPLDLLLIEAARRIQECVRDTDTVSRFGGDEFVLLLTHIKSTWIPCMKSWSRS